MSVIKKMNSIRCIKKNAKIAIVKSMYNSKITNTLEKSCIKELINSGISEKNIIKHTVPGAFELPLVCQKMAKQKKIDIVIALGCIIRGQTSHFDFIANECTRGIMDTALQFEKPILFGVLTTSTFKQAQDRIKGGKRGDKGIEVAQSAIYIINQK